MDLKSPHPFWPLKNGVLGVYPSLEEDLECEVIILGGGITGALIADELVKEGMEVILLDKRDVAGGSTSASTALLQYEIDTPLTELTRMIGQRDAEECYRVCRDSIGKIETIARSLDDPCGFQRKKSVYLASRPSDAPALREECAARRKAGIEVEYLDGGDIASMFSFRREGALLSQDAAEVDAYRLTHRLLTRASSRGLRVFDRTPVVTHRHDDDSVTVETEQGFSVKARRLVCATGYEALDILPRNIAALKSTFAFASEPLVSFTGWWEKCLIWETARPYLYMRTTSDGRAIVGGEDDPFRDPERRDRLASGKADTLAATFREMFPAIDLEVACYWAGTFGETKDGLAYIGAIPEFPRYLFALGFGGNGITYSAVAAEIIRDSILKRPNADAMLFRFDR